MLKNFAYNYLNNKFYHFVHYFEWRFSKKIFFLYLKMNGFFKKRSPPTSFVEEKTFFLMVLPIFIVDLR